MLHGLKGWFTDARDGGEDRAHLAEDDQSQKYTSNASRHDCCSNYTT
jgi:hypothetical protein